MAEGESDRKGDRERATVRQREIRYMFDLPCTQALFSSFVCDFTYQPYLTMQLIKGAITVRATDIKIDRVTERVSYS